MAKRAQCGSDPLCDDDGDGVLVFFVLTVGYRQFLVGSRA